MCASVLAWFFKKGGETSSQRIVSPAHCLTDFQTLAGSTALWKALCVSTEDSRISRTCTTLRWLSSSCTHGRKVGRDALRRTEPVEEGCSRGKHCSGNAPGPGGSGCLVTITPSVQLITVNLGGDSGPPWRQGALGVGAKSEMDNCSEKFLLDHGQTREKSPPGAGKEVILHSRPSAVKHGAQTRCFISIICKNFWRNTGIFL